MPSWWQRIGHNVQTAYVFTLFWWAARSILFQQVISGYIFVLTNSNKDVGVVKGIQGMSQLIFSFPAGYFADHSRRDTILQISGVIGIIGALLTFYAVEINSLMLINGVFALWGLFAAFQSPAMEALFADSIPHGERSFPFMVKYNISNLAMVLGPVVSALLFVYYGDVWQLEQLRPVLEVGTLLALIAAVLLFRFDDDQSIEQTSKDIQNSNERTLERSLRTPREVGTEMEMEYDYSDEDDEERQHKQQQQQTTEKTKLLTTRSSSKDVEAAAEEQEDGEEGRLLHVDTRFLCFRTRHVPYLLFVSDFIISNGAGMTINFFPLFFMQEYKLTPIQISVLFIAQPVLIMFLSYMAQRVSKSWGRMPIIVTTRCLSVLCLFSMTFAQPLALQIMLFLMRGGLMRCSQPLRRSILMDYVPKDVRARWNALEGVSVFSWSGSAVLGGYLIDAYDYRICFFITSLVYCVGLGLEAFLLPLTKHAIEK